MLLVAIAMATPLTYCWYYRWIEACVKEDLPLTTELEENLQNGVILAKLGHFFAPKIVPLKRIYDKDLTRFKVSFYINQCLQCLLVIGPHSSCA